MGSAALLVAGLPPKWRRKRRSDSAAWCWLGRQVSKSALLTSSISLTSSPSRRKRYANSSTTAQTPWRHNSKLKRRLHRIAAPALFVRGESDGLISQAYLEAYSALLPNARMLT